MVKPVSCAKNMSQGPRGDSAFKSTSWLAEDQESILSTPQQGQPPGTSVPGMQDSFLASMGTRHTCAAHIQGDTYMHTYTL